MSENMETTTAEPSTRSAIASLKDRAKRIRGRSISLLSGAGIAAAGCAIAFAIYLNTDPASSFNTVDLPAIAKTVIDPIQNNAPPSLNTAGEIAFQSATTAIFEIFNSSVWKVISVIGIVVAGLVFITGESVSFGVVIAPVFLFLAPMMLSILIGGSGETGTKASPPGAGNFIKQLVEEKRYAELAEVSSTMLPKGQAAYVNAQIAYISGKKESAQAALGQLDTSSLAGWSPDWGRISTMESYAFGSQRLSQSKQYAAEVKQKADSTYSTMSMLAGATMLLAIPGIALFGFGSSMRKRANRLETMLGPQEDQGPVLLTSSEPVRLTPQDSGWVPAWKRPVEVKAERTGRKHSDSAAMGVAAAAVAVASMDSSSSTCDASSSAGGDGGCI